MKFANLLSLMGRQRPLSVPMDWLWLWMLLLLRPSLDLDRDPPVKEYWLLLRSLGKMQRRVGRQEQMMAVLHSTLDQIAARVFSQETSSARYGLW